MGNFEKTLMGRKYYTKDLPALIESNNRLANALEKQNKLTEKRMAISAKEKLNERNNTK